MVNEEKNVKSELLIKDCPLIRYLELLSLSLGRVLKLIDRCPWLFFYELSFNNIQCRVLDFEFVKVVTNVSNQILIITLRNCAINVSCVLV